MVASLNTILLIRGYESELYDQVVALSTTIGDGKAGISGHFEVVGPDDTERERARLGADGDRPRPVAVADRRLWSAQTGRR
jgi:hypothetical protein